MNQTIPYPINSDDSVASSLLCRKSVAYSCETCVTMVHSMGWTIEMAALKERIDGKGHGDMAIW